MNAKSPLLRPRTSPSAGSFLSTRLPLSPASTSRNPSLTSSVKFASHPLVPVARLERRKLDEVVPAVVDATCCKQW